MAGAEPETAAEATDGAENLHTGEIRRTAYTTTPHREISKDDISAL